MGAIAGETKKKKKIVLNVKWVFILFQLDRLNRLFHADTFVIEKNQEIQNLISLFSLHTRPVFLSED